MTATEKDEITSTLQSYKNALAPGPLHKLIDKFCDDLTGILYGAGGKSEQLNAGHYQPTLVINANSLPSIPPPLLNDECIVKNATVATNGTTVAGGGSFRVLCRYDGANWIIV